MCSQTLSGVHIRKLNREYSLRLAIKRLLEFQKDCQCWWHVTSSSLQVIFIVTFFWISTCFFHWTNWRTNTYRPMNTELNQLLVYNVILTSPLTFAYIIYSLCWSFFILLAIVLYSTFSLHGILTHTLSSFANVRCSKHVESSVS